MDGRHGSLTVVRVGVDEDGAGARISVHQFHVHGTMEALYINMWHIYSFSGTFLVKLTEALIREPVWDLIILMTTSNDVEAFMILNPIQIYWMSSILSLTPGISP